MRILVVDDDARLARAVRRGLETEGYAVDVAAETEQGEWLATENDYDAIVLDVMLPGGSGTDLCRRLRAAGNWVPILILTAKNAPDDEVSALDSGADDFLAKPFSFVVLVARIRALLRRHDDPRPAVLEVGDLTLDPARHRVARGAEAIELTPRQFALLEFLMRRAGEVVPKRVIIEHVWDFTFDGDANIVEVHIGQLRKRIDAPFGRTNVKTVRGAGYCLDEDGP
ncbi:MAG: response regulator transcription factor [Marmoricola sp.]